MKLFVVLICLINYAIGGQGMNDEVTSLPFANFDISFKHYSGYLNASDTVRLHYWFTESQTNPKTDPLMLWLNGGPGCSSVDGLLTELGPFRISSDGHTIMENVYAWNKLANVIFLESPQCVGFSYDTRGACSTDDDATAEQNHQALIDFLRKFPEYKGREFWIAGESYGGIYVPTLSVLIAKDTDNFPNYKGSLVGNGCMDDRFGNNGYIYFSYYHGLVGVENWRKTVDTCCGEIPLQDCDFFKQANGSESCQKETFQYIDAAWDSGNDPYNLYAYCTQGNEPTKYGLYMQKLMQTNKVPFRSESLLKFSNQRGEQRDSGNAKTTPPPIVIPCTDTRNERFYMNNQDVRTALHIPDDLDQYWTVCSQNLNYTKKYDSMRNQLLTLLSMNKRVLVYNGDVDMACNFLSDEWFIDSLNRTSTQKRGPWYYGNNQVAGYMKQYDGITFTTVKGAGHFVPSDKPGEALQMVYNFIHNSTNFSQPVNGTDLNPVPLLTTTMMPKMTSSNSAKTTSKTTMSSGYASIEKAELAMLLLLTIFVILT